MSSSHGIHSNLDRRSFLQGVGGSLAAGHGLQDLAPYAHTTVHAKFWDRFGEPDVQRNVRIMLNNNFTGVFALEYEAGPWDGVEGAQHLFQEVLAAM